ncbi:NAD(P)H-binding protein [Nocardiopsis sp. CNT-189]|uniref:NAD(P)H-binding protein n=1 Tax=Nocardiopsis oceanisediminis TaxID=2816862 RepID=UPI003B3AAD59
MDRAAAGGVRRVVLLSTLGVVTRPFGRTRIAMRALEDVLRRSGLEWSILRPGGFASNALWRAESVRAQRRRVPLRPPGSPRAGPPRGQATGAWASAHSRSSAKSPSRSPSSGAMRRSRQCSG